MRYKIKHLFQICIWKLSTLNKSKCHRKLDAHQGAKMDGSQVDGTHTVHTLSTFRETDRERANFVEFVREVTRGDHWKCFSWHTCMRAFYAFHFVLSDHKNFFQQNLIRVIRSMSIMWHAFPYGIDDAAINCERTAKSIRTPCTRWKLFTTASNLM